MSLHGEENHTATKDTAQQTGARVTAAINAAAAGDPQLKAWLEELVNNPAAYLDFQRQNVLSPHVLKAMLQVVESFDPVNGPTPKDPKKETPDTKDDDERADLPPAEDLPEIPDPEDDGWNSAKPRPPGPERPERREDDLSFLPKEKPPPPVVGEGTPSRVPAPPAGGVQDGPTPGTPDSRQAPPSATASRRGQDWIRGFETFARAARQARETRRSVERGITRRDRARQAVHQERPAPSLEALAPKRESRQAAPAPRELAARRPVLAPTAGKSSPSAGTPAPGKAGPATAANATGAPPVLPPKKKALPPIATTAAISVSALPATGFPALSFKVPGLPLAGVDPAPVAFSTGDWTVGENLDGETGDEAPLPETGADALIPLGVDSAGVEDKTEIAASVGIPAEWETPLALLLLLGLAGVTALGSAGGAAGSAAGLGPSRFPSFSVARLFAPIWEGRSRAAVAGKPAPQRRPAGIPPPRPALYRSVLGLAWAATFGFAFYLVRGLLGVLGAKRRRDR